MNHVLKVDPVVEPVSVADVKTHTGVTHDTDDTLISEWVTSGRELAESFQRRAYVQQTWQGVYDCFPPVPFYLHRPPTISFSSVKYYDTEGNEATFDSSNYFVDLDSEVSRFSLAYGRVWPNVILRPMNGVIMEYIAGYGVDGSTVPSRVKDAIYLYCTWRYDNRAGEAGSVPKAFYNLLEPDRCFL